VVVPDRPKFQESLKAAGVPTGIYYGMPLHLHAAFRTYGGGPGSLPVCERLAQHIVALPMHPYLTEAEIVQVTDAVRRAV
jgi:dTDP-4-amino-4,6-dideoxygalactose transaminase